MLTRSQQSVFRKVVFFFKLSFHLCLIMFFMSVLLKLTVKSLLCLIVAFFAILSAISFQLTLIYELVSIKTLLSGTLFELCVVNQPPCWTGVNCSPCLNKKILRVKTTVSFCTCQMKHIYVSLTLLLKTSKKRRRILKKLYIILCFN